jgi:hypothetical protein
MNVRGYNKRMFEPTRRTSSTLNDSFTRDKKKLRRPEKAITSYFGKVGWRGWREATTLRQGCMNGDVQHETPMTQNGCLHDATKDFKKTTTELPVVLISLAILGPKTKNIIISPHRCRCDSIE